MILVEEAVVNYQAHLNNDISIVFSFNFQQTRDSVQ